VRIEDQSRHFSSHPEQIDILVSNSPCEILVEEIPQPFGFSSLQIGLDGPCRTKFGSYDIASSQRKLSSFENFTGCKSLPTSHECIQLAKIIPGTTEMRLTGSANTDPISRPDFHSLDFDQLDCDVVPQQEWHQALECGLATLDALLIVDHGNVPIVDTKH
jgi:hypothetical protein